MKSDPFTDYANAVLESYNTAKPEDRLVQIVNQLKGANFNQARIAAQLEASMRALNVVISDLALARTETENLINLITGHEQLKL